MENKPYELGILVGRFQVLHAGHEMMVNTACQLCREVGIFVGSSQESGTAKNPLSFDLRCRMLRQVFGDRVKIFPLPDIGVGNNSRWGDYVLQNVAEQFGRWPDLLVSGKEARRLDWFDSVAGATIAELYIPKTVDISASRMREYLLNDDYAGWSSYVSPALLPLYDQLRRAVLASRDNTETQSI